MQNALLNIDVDGLNEYEDELGVCHRSYVDKLDELHCPVSQDPKAKLGLAPSDMKVLNQRIHRRFVERFAKTR